MAKYTQSIKDSCVAAAKEGISLKVIQNTIGPNPMATMRYLKAVGIDYKELKVELKAAGKLQKAFKDTTETNDKTVKEEDTETEYEDEVIEE